MFPTENVAKKEGLLIGKNLESQFGKNSGSGGKKSTGKKVGEKIGKEKIGSKKNVGEKRKSKKKQE